MWWICERVISNTLYTCASAPPQAPYVQDAGGTFLGIFKYNKAMKNIVLCGSMKVKDKILAVSDKLKELGFNVLLPVECMEGKPKNIASRAHFKRIIDPKNEAILIVNETKNDIENYIGPNSFAEAAFGFYFEKKIYLLNEIYEPYQDELEGWNAIPLHGDLGLIKVK